MVMEGLRGSLRSMVSAPSKQWGSEFIAARQLSLPDETLTDFVTRMTGTSRVRPWRVPSVRQALGVPSIHRSVSLISSTVGMLSMQGFQKGALMDAPPQLILRPDPYQTPQAFYSGSAASMAKYGEIIWWIAKRDNEGNPSSLILAPSVEVKVEENKDNRLLPYYRWGSKTGTRYSGANRQGSFVHIVYPIGEPLALRGEGPLQLGKAAMSVTVEAQEWAANFYADGGNPSVVIKHAGKLGATRLDPVTGLPDDVNGLNEAERLRSQWTDRPHNVPRVIDQMIESVDYHQPNEAGAQMLDARQHQDGDSARLFGIPGALLEYIASGSTLTYQNRTELKGALVELCLMPLYLEPMEQAMTDLLPRQITARFNVKGFLRADIKTRFEVHGIAIDKGIYDPEYAQQEEGIIAGDVEFAPVPFAPPAAVPASLSVRSMREVRCPTCQRLVGKADGALEVMCRHCKQLVAA